MTDELKQVHYNDVMTDLASAVEQTGARKFLYDFRHNYPAHFEELKVQITRLDSKQVARLFVKDADTM